MIGLLALFDDEPEIDVSAHLDQVTEMSLWAIALLIAMFLVRPELWRKLFLERIDPRPAALMRIAFGLVVLWTFLDLTMWARFLFTDEGMWLNDTARNNYGDKLKTLWDPEHGFQRPSDMLRALWGKFTFLHMRSDPPFVFTVYAVMLLANVLMIFGVFTRTTTLLTWIGTEMIYRYSPVFYTGGDTVVRVFMFLGVFAQWGEAYSVDAWRRRRKAILRGATLIPGLRNIPAWPMRLSMLQLCIIYTATGMLKSGNTWVDGTALYYALNLDHFYRFPQSGVVTFMHWIGVLPLMSVLVHWWEILFPVAAIGVCLNRYERERAAGTWPQAAAWRRAIGYMAFMGAWCVAAWVAGLGMYYFVPEKALPMPREKLQIVVQYCVAVVPIVLTILYVAFRWLKESPRVEAMIARLWDRGLLGKLASIPLRMLRGMHTFVLHWVLGKRFWLVIGFGMHIGIDVGMNVGTFAEVMMAVYFAWLSGDEIESAWRYLASRPARPGEGSRPLRKRKIVRYLLAPVDRLIYRAPGKVYTILHNPDDASVRRAALLRPWDLGHRLEFAVDEDVPPEQLWLRIEGDKASRQGIAAAGALTKIFPGFWLLRPFRLVPGLGALVGWLVLKILRQRAR